LESQHVKLLTEGYLRGWLNFDYSLPTSTLRERLILDHIYEERIYGLMHNKLLIDTVIRSSLPYKEGVFDTVYTTASNMIGLKLPSLKPADTIENNGKQSSSGIKGLSKQEIEEYKALLNAANKKLTEKNNKGKK
jgi:hypothetical protein